MVQDRDKVLTKNEDKFRDNMKDDQDEFKETYDNLRLCIENFHQYTEIKNHEEVAKTV